MKKETINYSKERVTLSVDDVKELLPDDKFEYQMYRDYRDEIDIKTFKECMPDESKYKNEDGTIQHHNFVYDWKTNLENMVWEWNIDWITNQIENELRENIEKALEKKGIEFDELDLDFYHDDLYSVDLDLDYILSRSRIDWNVVRHSNFDGFTENEVYEDNGAIKQIVDLFPDLVDKNDLERACAEGIYEGSDLKVNFRSTMLDFLNVLETGKVDISGTQAVLHLSINGSGSPEFTLGKGTVELGKTYGTKYDRWDWQLDGKYGIVDVYGEPLNKF